MSTAAAEMLAGDREAYAEVCRELRPRAVGLCHYLLGSSDEAHGSSHTLSVTLNRR